jgi:hypothetical protein
MKLELTDEFEAFMRETFPCVVKAETAIYEATGITLEQMRSKCREAAYANARAIFYHLCFAKVGQNTYLTSYLNRDHSSGSYYNCKYRNNRNTDFLYLSMLDKITKIFENK